MTGIRTKRPGTESKPLSEVMRIKLALLAAKDVIIVNSTAVQIGELVMSGEYELIKLTAASTRLHAAVVLPDDASDEAIVNAVRAIGQARAEKLDRMRAAFDDDRMEEAMTLARTLCNYQPKEGAPRHGSQKVH